MYRFRMVMQKGPAPGTGFDISKPQMLIGRDPACDIVISDSEVSRRHARLVVREDVCVLEDLGSTNGTFVNGRRISAPIELHPGDVIMMGENVLLAFESQAFDPNATVLSAAAQQSPAPTAQVPTGGSFQDQVPQSPPVAPPPGTGPLPPQMQPTPATAKRKVLPWMLAGGGVLMLICACAVFLLWVDMTYRWCQFFPFLAGCG